MLDAVEDASGICSLRLALRCEAHGRIRAQLQGCKRRGKTGVSDTHPPLQGADLQNPRALQYPGSVLSSWLCYVSGEVTEGSLGTSIKVSGVWREGFCSEHLDQTNGVTLDGIAM